MPPLIPMEAIDTLSLTVAVKEAVLLLELPEEYQVSVELIVVNEEIVGVCVSILLKLTSNPAVTTLSFKSVTVAITLSVLEP